MWKRDHYHLFEGLSFGGEKSGDDIFAGFIDGTDKRGSMKKILSPLKNIVNKNPPRHIATQACKKEQEDEDQQLASIN